MTGVQTCALPIFQPEKVRLSPGCLPVPMNGNILKSQLPRGGAGLRGSSLPPQPFPLGDPLPPRFGVSPGSWRSLHPAPARPDPIFLPSPPAQLSRKRHREPEGSLAQPRCPQALPTPLPPRVRFCLPDSALASATPGPPHITGVTGRAAAPAPPMSPAEWGDGNNPNWPPNLTCPPSLLQIGRASCRERVSSPV